uniref:GAG-pre-integrase domain-containing protein n=1 Tax=Cannabis sativa TaxID=3483 RepID=A0A803Q5I3_CANSA
MEIPRTSNGGASRLNYAQTENNQQTMLPKSYPVSFTHSLSIKLDEHNYLPWRHQVLASIKGSRLQKYLDSDKAPPKYLSATDERNHTVNPEFEDWEQQDNLLVSWLLSSMSEKTTNKMIGCDTTAEIWLALNEYYTALNAANIGLYKTQLRNTKMTGSLNDYLLKIKGIVDLLATIGHKQTSQDHIEAIFNGLPAEYDVFVTSVTTRKDVYTVAEIEALLMAQSARIDKHTKNLDILKAEANLSHSRFNGYNTYNRGPYSAPTIPPGFNRGGPPRADGFTGNPMSRGNGLSSNRGGPNPQRGDPFNTGRGSSQQMQQKAQCQICHKFGHLAKQCFYRFDKSFTGPESFVNFPVTANIAEMSSAFATPKTIQDDNWYPDSGASHHLTPDSSNLEENTSYACNEHVLVGNGAGLNIESVVSKFAQDNNVMFEFHPFFCCVKDRTTQKILLVGNVENGLYKFDSSQLSILSSPSASVPAYLSTPQCHTHHLSNSSSDFSLWHSRLGHPTAKIVKMALSKCNITLSNKNVSDVCSSCCLGKSHKLPFSSSTTTYTEPLQLLHSDLWGPAPINSANGYRYYISFVDAYSRYTWLYLLRTRDEALPTFTKFKTQIE